MAVPAFSWWRGLALVAAAATCVFGLVYSGVAWRVDASLYDAMLSANETDADDRILVVAIDEGSIAALGRWPWSRGVHAQLVDRLSSAQPRAIALDVMFAEPDAAHPAGDDALAGAISRSGRVVLPVMVEPVEPGGIPVEVLPLPALVQASAGLGHAAVDVDPDGVTRSAYLQAGLGEPHWPAL
ncbi:MAG: CHASE2 domain-containing protein, partial [Xanthomonadales bacterium]|nr:CHASE2 domain-containing protein [Xanthomonadales bacterium]